MDQALDGTLNGRWSADTSIPDIACPPSLGSAPAGPLNGVHTILQVQFSLLGIGDFSGQATNDRILKGSVETCGQVYPMIFSPQSAVP